MVNRLSIDTRRVTIENRSLLKIIDDKTRPIWFSDASLRFTQRDSLDTQRVYFHGEAAKTAKEATELLINNYDPPKMNVPTLRVDTTNGYEPKIEKIVSFVS